MQQYFRRIGLPLAVLFVLAFVAGPASAQTTTAAIQGTVSDASGAVPGATVTAANVDSGFQYSAVTDATGAFTFGGLAPGSYEVRVALEGFQEQAQVVRVLVGQTLTLKVELKQKEVFIGGVTVVGERTKLLIDTRTPEVATNITQEQIQNLPQNNRNFLAFAALAPGVRFTTDTDAVGQEFSSGGANAKQVNVFIDGLSYKNDIIKGGAFMQDSSRGNPFPQSAVQEYQVLTQNYKAEYEKAAAAVITAVTKSGGNAFHGDLFYLYQDKDMVQQDEFAKARGDTKGPYERKQYGLSIGGPIMRDKLHFFVSAERNDRDVVASVYRGSSWDSAPNNVKSRLETYPTGTLSAPLKSDLYFGKLSWQPTPSQTMELSYHNRDENEIRGFGGQRVKEGASDFSVKTDAAVLRHQVTFGNTLNEIGLTWQKLEWIDTATDASKPHENFIGLLDVGGKDYLQDLKQTKFGVRDDLSYYFDWQGSHAVKTGVTVNWLDYDMSKAAFGNPYYEYRSNENWQFPYLARFGFGNPALKFSNTQFGIFVQDDWRVTANLTVSAGVRWDYETNMLNNNWVTPADVVTGLETACKGSTCIHDLFDINNYISTGDNRSSYKMMFQPRLGFSWDLSGQGSTVVFGGWGIYYDRVTLNDIYDEQYRHSWKQYTFCFSADGSPTPGCSVPAIQWDPAYLTPEGLASIIQKGQTPGPEIFLLANDTRPPRSQQWTLGLRQQFGSWLTALTYANSRGYNGLAWSFGTLPPGTPFNDRWGAWIPIPGYGFIMRSYDVRKTWYDGYFLTIDKPYTADSKWGLNIAYTYAKSYMNASKDEGTAFSFDFIPTDWPRFPGNNDERHRFVASGTVGLPFGFRVSSIITLGSGTPYDIADASAGWDKFVYRFNAARPKKYSFLGIKEWAYRSVDLRLEWETKLAGDFRLGLIGEAFNVLNYHNYYYDGGWGSSGFKPPEGNPKFGEPTGEYNTRRYQVGLRLAF